MKVNKEEFLRVLEENQGIIFKICNSYCADSEDRKDLAQDIIVQLWKSFGNYNPQYKITTWLYRIALNVAISSSRKHSTRNKYSSTIDQSFLTLVDEDKADLSEELDLLQRFIQQLDNLSRALLLLWLDDNSYEEIAEILNISASNVGTKLGRIKKQLKKQFEDVES